MKKVIVLSHCIMNQFCELDEPLTKKLFKQTIEEIVERGIGILQLPCPELSYQALERKSIIIGDERAEEYEKYCRSLLKSTVKNIREYAQNEIQLVKLVGIETSPSCSTVNSSGIMMNALIEMLEQEDIRIATIDMPHIFDGNENIFIADLLS